MKKAFVIMFQFLIEDMVVKNDQEELVKHMSKPFQFLIEDMVEIATHIATINKYS